MGAVKGIYSRDQDSDSSYIHLSGTLSSAQAFAKAVSGPAMITIVPQAKPNRPRLQTHISLPTTYWPD
jgi:hypothetical protein